MYLCVRAGLGLGWCRLCVGCDGRFRWCSSGAIRVRQLLRYDWLQTSDGGLRQLFYIFHIIVLLQMIKLIAISMT